MKKEIFAKNKCFFKNIFFSSVFFSILILATFSFIFSTKVEASGFGVSPPYVKNSELTRGSVYEQRILLVRGSPDIDMMASVTIEVPGAEEWITIEQGNEILLPKGENRVPMVVRIEIPKKAKYDNYEGRIRVRTSVVNDEDRSSGSVTIALGAQIEVDLNVTDKVIRKFEITKVEIKDFNQGRTVRWLEYPGKMLMVMDLKNTGNVPISPSKVRVDIYDLKGEKFFERTEHTNKIKKIEPFKTGEVIAELPSHLPTGSYQGQFYIYNGDDVVRSGSLSFSIREQGTIEGDYGYGFSGLSLWHKTTIVGPFVLLFLVLVTVIFIYSSRSRAFVLGIPKRFRKNLRNIVNKFRNLQLRKRV